MDEPDELIRQHLQLIYDNTRDLAFLIEVGADGAYRVASVNRAFLERTRLQPDRVIGRPIEKILGDDQLEYVRTRYDEAVLSRAPCRYETRTTLGGETFYLDTTLVPVFDDDGRCTHLIGVSRDISDNKRERQALRHEKQRAENYLDIAEALILALDRDANVTLLNRKGYQLLGYAEGSLLGRNWCELCIAPEKRAGFMARLHRAIDAGEVGRNVNYVVTGNGERRLISWANSLIRNDAGEVVEVLCSGEDITDQRRAEQAMIASQRVLAANEVAAAVAHDFNNSLQGILGNIELALISDEGAALRAHLDTAAKLTDDAARRLEVLRGPAAGPTDDGEILDLNELIDDVIAQTRPLWKDEAQRHGRNLRVLRQFATDTRPVAGNRSELRSVLYNIVKNAVEAIVEDGTIAIESRFANGLALITVSDDGIGMDAATSTRIFQPFFSTKGLEVGRGLGMSASNNIVRAHGGDIRVASSAPGQGTTIEVRIPALQHRLAEATDGEPAPAAGRHHVLWVDDDPQIRALARDYLSALQQTGDVAESGEQALQMLSSQAYSVVITDIGMPGMNGLELAARVRQAMEGRVPVIALTGWGDSINEDDAPPAGIVQVIAKPVRLDQVRESLNALRPQPRSAT